MSANAPQGQIGTKLSCRSRESRLSFGVELNFDDAEHLLSFQALLAFYLRRSHNLEQSAEISLKLEELQVESEEALRFMKIVMCDLGRGQLSPLSPSLPLATLTTLKSLFSAEYVPALYLYAFEKQPKNLNLGIVSSAASQPPVPSSRSSRVTLSSFYAPQQLCLAYVWVKDWANVQKVG